MFKTTFFQEIIKKENLEFAKEKEIKNTEKAYLHYKRSLKVFHKIKRFLNIIEIFHNCSFKKINCKKERKRTKR